MRPDRTPNSVPPASEFGQLVAWLTQTLRSQGRSPSEAQSVARTILGTGVNGRTRAEIRRDAIAAINALPKSE